MKSALAAIMITMAGLSALPASAREAARPAAQPVAQSATMSADELPLTDRFASLLTGYRNCVLAEVEASPLGRQQDMAKEAMSACATSRGELRAQLVSDIAAQQPKLGNALVLRSADSGMAQVDPMIEAAAVDWAHLRYVRDMI